MASSWKRAASMCQIAWTRHIARANVRAKARPCGVDNWCWSIRSLMILVAKPDSTAVAVRLFSRRPCLRAFCEEWALPRAVRGPRDLAPLRRAVARLRAESERTFLIAIPLCSREKGLGDAGGAKLLKGLRKFCCGGCD